MLFVALLYPLIWVWQRLHPNGGAPYDLANASCTRPFDSATALFR
jgi:hypothetical protein